MNIVIGKHDSKDVKLDVDRLMATRLLIQADSGGGKSWAVRLIAEQLFGKVQVIIIDPEGEFASLREKFGYVLVGKGGETPADTRSAALVAHKLIELRASAICDIYEMKQRERHIWVKAFLDSLIDLPKNLWGHRVVVIVDEAQMFCPEKGKGESEAYDAMVDLCARGRKRGLCAVFATQRLGRLSKDATSQLRNRLIGVTFEDIDRKRAAELFGVLKTEERQFFKEIQLLEPGNFFALGRAISIERILVHVGNVATTHPEAGSARHAVKPPPPPDAIAKLLPKLSDLPKAAEEKARTEADLRKEIRDLKTQLRNAPAANPVEVKVADTRAIEKAVHLLKTAADKQIAERDRAVMQLVKGIKSAMDALRAAGEQATKMKLPPFELPKISAGEIQKTKEDSPQTTKVRLVREPPVTHTPRPDISSNGDLAAPEQRILNAIAWMESIGISEPMQTAVAFLAGYTYGGGAFNNPRGALRTKGLVQYHGERIALTDEGRTMARAPETPLTQEEMHAHVLEVLPGPEQKLLKELLEIYPKDISKDELAERVHYAPGSGAFNNPCGRLRTLGLVEYPTGGRVIAKEFLFPE